MCVLCVNISINYMYNTFLSLIIIVNIVVVVVNAAAAQQT